MEYLFRILNRALPQPRPLGYKNVCGEHMFSLLNKRSGRGNNSPLVGKLVALLTRSSRRPRTPFREHPYLLEASPLTNRPMALGWSSNCLLFLGVISAGRA